MKLYLPAALIGIFLIPSQAALRAQDGEAKKELAIAEIKKLGGKVEIDAKSPDMPVVGIDLRQTKVVDAILEHLKPLTKIRRLSLADTTVTDNGIVFVQGLTNLEVLELRRTKVTNKGLAHLKRFAKLQKLDLGGTGVTDRGLANLSSLTNLKVLSLNGVKVSDAGLAHLKGLTKLKELNLKGTMVTPAGIQALQKALPKVKIMHDL